MNVQACMNQCSQATDKECCETCVVAKPKLTLNELFAGMSYSLRKLIYAHGIQTVDHLLQYSEKEMLERVEGIGQVKLDKIKVALRLHGLALDKI